jgi:hypothetical protein
MGAKSGMQIALDIKKYVFLLLHSSMTSSQVANAVQMHLEETILHLQVNLTIMCCTLMLQTKQYVSLCCLSLVCGIISGKGKKKLVLPSVDTLS